MVNAALLWTHVNITTYECGFKRKVASEHVIEWLLQRGPCYFFSFSEFLGTLKNSPSSSEPLSTSHELQNICKSLQYWYCNICNTKIALKTSSLPLACVCGPVTISWSQSIQVSHYPRLLTIPFMSIYCCWGVRWRANGTKRDWATSLLCKKVGPNIVGLLILQEYSSLITCKAIYTKHVN